MSEKKRFGETLLEDRFHAGANEDSTIGSIRVSMGGHRLVLIRWDVDGKQYGNHYLLGHPPFDLKQYRQWLTLIAANGEPFSPVF